MPPELKDCVTRIVYFTLNLREEIELSPDTIDAKECRDSLLNLLDSVPLADSRRATTDAIQYALTVWIDESLSRLPWPYARAWEKYPLETVLYGTNCGRWRFFEQAELAGNSEDWDALAVFRFCVQFGFRGIYGKRPFKVQVNDRLPMLRTRQPTPVAAAAVASNNDASRTSQVPAITIPLETRSRQLRPLLPATLSEWCQRTFSRLESRSKKRSTMFMPHSLLGRALPLGRVLREWAIVMAIGGLLSAMLFAIGN